VTVAGCGSCGEVAGSRRPAGRLGEPAGPCAKCGRLMFWMRDEYGVEPRGELGAAAVEKARPARRRLASRRATDPV
jgi:hypothetical protein